LRELFKTIEIPFIGQAKIRLYFPAFSAARFTVFGAEFRMPQVSILRPGKAQTQDLTPRTSLQQERAAQNIKEQPAKMPAPLRRAGDNLLGLAMACSL
jgi:hypothetical protein